MEFTVGLFQTWKCIEFDAQKLKQFIIENILTSMCVFLFLTQLGNTSFLVWILLNCGLETVWKSMEFQTPKVYEP